jgi:hypothetical protein
MRKRDIKGQLLLEVLIALTVLGLVATTVVKVSTRSLKGVRISGDRQMALSFAGQVLIDIDEVRTDDTALFFSGASGTEDCGPLGDNSEYQCEISYVFNSPPDSSSVSVMVEISWAEGDGMSNVTLDKVLTKTRL